MGPETDQFRRRPAKRRPVSARLDPATGGTTKSEKPHRDLTEKRRDRVLPLVFHGLWFTFGDTRRRGGRSDSVGPVPGVGSWGSQRTEGSPPWRAKRRVAILYSVGPIQGPDQEAVIRFSGKAPQWRARSGGRHRGRCSGGDGGSDPNRTGLSLARSVTKTNVRGALGRTSRRQDTEEREGTDMARIEIIGGPHSSYVWVVRMVCEEKQVPYDLTIAAPQSPESHAIHPLGKIPSMRHGEVALFESKAIATYIDRAFPGLRLIPDDAFGMAEVEQ
jgi:hypothetical protein